MVFNIATLQVAMFNLPLRGLILCLEPSAPSIYFLLDFCFTEIMLNFNIKVKAVNICNSFELLAAVLFEDNFWGISPGVLPRLDRSCCA